MDEGKKLAAQSSPAAKVRFRHRSLLQDYEDLIKEGEAKRKNLQIANQKKLKLHAEVKFLRRRYKSLLQNHSGGLQFRLKTKPKSRFFVARPSNANASSEFFAKDQSSKLRDAVAPSPSAMIDLNQVSLPVTIAIPVTREETMLSLRRTFSRQIGEDMDEYQFNAEPLKADEFGKISVEANLEANDLKLSIRRDVGHGSSNQTGKRKITENLCPFTNLIPV